MADNLRRPFKYCDTLETFNTLKVAADSTNTKYKLGVTPLIYEGKPEILFNDFVLIEDEKKFWSHGVLYGGTDSKGVSTQMLRKLHQQAGPAVRIPSRKTVISIITQFDNISINIEAYQDYPGILPSIVGIDSAGPSIPLESQYEKIKEYFNLGCDYIQAWDNYHDDYHKQLIKQNDVTYKNDIIPASYIVYDAGYLPSSQTDFSLDYNLTIPTIRDSADTSDEDGVNTKITNKYQLTAHYCDFSNPTEVIDFIDKYATSGNWIIIRAGGYKPTVAQTKQIVDCINDYIESGDVIYLQAEDAARALYEDVQEIDLSDYYKKSEVDEFFESLLKFYPIGEDNSEDGGGVSS